MVVTFEIQRRCRDHYKVFHGLLSLYYLFMTVLMALAHTMLGLLNAYQISEIMRYTMLARTIAQKNSMENSGLIS